ncbi:MAG: cytochrome C [Pseudomonadota bacterium]
MKLTTYASIAALLAAPAFAGGHADAEAGAEAFSQCQQCHVVTNDAGEVLAGRNGRTGPNLYGVIGRQPGSVDGFRYQKAIQELGESVVTAWTAEEIEQYLLDPTDYLRTKLDDRRARSGMAYKVRAPEDAANLAAFLATFSE